jgi:hypothetical protein
MWRLIGVLALLTMIAPLAAQADSATVSYQGVLRTTTEVPVADDNYPMEFRIYTVATLGAPVWGPEAHPTVATHNGLFSVYLGSIVPLGSVFTTHGTLWLEIGANTGSGMETYAPRVPLASVPYAKHADTATTAASATNAANANTLGGQAPSAFAPATHNHPASQINSGTLDIARLPVGTDAAQVAQGNHSHTLNGLSNVNVPAPATGSLLSFNGSQWEDTNAPQIDGVRKLYFSGTATGSSQIDCRILCSDSASLVVTAVFNHCGYINEYGCARVFLLGSTACDWNPAMNVVNIVNVTGAHGGTWNIYSEGPGAMLIRKEVSTIPYSGTGQWFVTVEGSGLISKR